MTALPKGFRVKRPFLTGSVLTLLALGLFTRFPMTCPPIMAAEPKADESGVLQTLFDFSDPAPEKELAKEWKTVNDNVMGGISEGKFQVADGKLVFSGDLSLENRGGFASVRSKQKKLDLGNAQAIRIRFQGDGRTYYLSLYVPTLMIAHSYRKAFKTEPGKWQEVTIPLDKFQSTAFGQPIANARPVNPARIYSIGFLLADKKSGPFHLEVKWIKAVEKKKD